MQTEIDRALVPRVACVLLLTAVAMAQQTPALFKPFSGPQAFGDEATQARAGLPVKRSRMVQIDISQINLVAAQKILREKPKAFGRDDSHPLAELQVLKQLRLNLFDDKTLNADLRRITISPDSKTVVWSGTIVDMKFGQVTLATTGTSVSGNVTTDSGSLYEIRPVVHHDGAGFIFEMDQREFPKEGEPIRVRTPEGVADVSPGTDDGSKLDVVVVYTSSAKQAAGGDDAIKNLIAIGIQETNQGYANSGVIQRVRLVHAAEVQYDESEGFDKALERLANPNDGYMDDVPKLRDKYGADLVSLWINNKQLCGLAYLMDKPSPSFESKAYSVVHVGCATGYYSFGHEMGHNQGCQHDRANATGSPGAFSYSYGFQETSGKTVFRTIMAYDCSPSCPRVNYWSNPGIQYQGMPTGIAINDGAAADNAETLNSTRRIAAGWRQSVVAPSGVASSTNKSKSQRAVSTAAPPTKK
jgi:hypothetical protein